MALRSQAQRPRRLEPLSESGRADKPWLLKKKQWESKAIRLPAVAHQLKLFGVQSHKLMLGLVHWKTTPTTWKPVETRVGLGCKLRSITVTL